MTNYRKGVRFEYRVRDLFRKHDYHAERKAASSPYDIIAMKDGRVVFIVDAKKTSQRDKDHLYISKDDIEKLLKYAEKVGAQPVVTYGFWRTPIYMAHAEDLLEEDGKHVRLEEGVDFDKFLENFDVEV